MRNERDLREFAEGRRKARRRRRVRNGAFCAAALAVVMAAAYLMMFPASTLETQTVCGLEEHTHDESCYQAGETELICTLQEEAAHTHDESCYMLEDGSVSETPVCGLEETQGHTHTDECYAQGESILICGLTEHVHTDACLASETEADASAETQAQTETAAPETEDTENETEEADVQDETKAQDETQKKLQTTVARASTGSVTLLDSQITAVKLYYDNDGTWIEITSATTNVPGNAMIRLEIDYANVSITDLLNNNCTLTYNIGDVLQNPTTSGTIYSGSTVIGTIALDDDNNVTIIFDESWLNKQKSAGQSVVSGEFYVAGTLDWNDADDDDNITVSVGGVNITVNLEPDSAEKYGTVTPVKAVDAEIVQETDGDYLVYTLTATAGDEGAVDVAMVDTFSTASKQYIASYVGVTTTSTSTDDISDVTETRTADAAAGYVYIGAEPTETTPVPEAGGSVTAPGTLVWYIGDMAANETRTLTYKVKLADGYTGGLAKGTLTNTVNAYSGSYAKGSSSADYTPYVKAYPKKTVGTYTEDATNGGGYITYTVEIIASADNSYTLTNLQLYDSLYRTAADIQAYLTYDETSFHLYNGDTEINYTSLTVDNTNKTFKLYVESLEAGQTLKLTYSVKADVGLEAYGSAGIYNRAVLYDDSENTGSNLTQYDAYNGDKTISLKTWNRKTAGSQLTAEQTIAITAGDSVYDITGGAVSAIDSPGSFSVPAGSFPYTVLVNEDGGWNLSSATFTDTLGDYLRYTGYVKVEIYDTSSTDISTSLSDAAALAAVQTCTQVKTVWLKIDGLQSFSFKPSDVGLDGAYAYVLTYYAKPYNTDNISSVTVGNAFTISGTVVGPGGQEFTYRGASSQTSVRVEDDSNFGASKEGWYYEYQNDDSSADYPRGTVYWAIRLSGNRIPAGAGIKDVVQSTAVQVLRSDALIGVYKVTLPGGSGALTEAWTSLEEFQDALADGTYVQEIGSSYYTYTKTSDGQATLIFNTEISLDDGEYVYVLLKTAKVAPEADKREQYTAKNTVYTTGDSGSTWEEANSASVVTLESGSVLKESQGAYTLGYDEDGNLTWKTVVSGAGSGASQLDQSVITENGTYLEWLIEVNWDGSIDGLAQIQDAIPEGTELTYVRLYQLGSGYGSASAQPATVENDELESDAGWTRNEFTSGGLDCIYYCQQSTGIVRWDVDNLIRGLTKSTYSVTFQVVCKVTDSDALQGETTVFSNTAVVTDQEGMEHKDSDQITVAKQSLSKKSTYISGSSYPFEITVNPDGEDLSADSDTITLIDELGSSLTLDITSLSVTNTYTGATVTDWSAQIEVADDGSQTLRLTIPDNMPLTITYEAYINAAPGVKITISNVAHWEGKAAPEDGTVNVDSFSYEAGGSAGAAESPSFSLLKLDQYDTSSCLSGAVFTVTKVKAYQDDGTFADVTGSTTYTKTTDEDGEAVFSGGNDGEGLWMEYNAVYCLVETYAPPGYELDETPVYFAIAKQLGDGSYPTFPDGVKVWYRDAAYQYTAYNHKGGIEVEKIFQDEDGNAETAADGSYSFGIYEEEPVAGDEQPLQTIVITYESGAATYTRNGVKVSSPSFSNLTLGSVYYIYELDAQGQPISDGALVTLNGTAFTVSYSNGSEATALDGETSSVTVVNQSKVFLLPTAGGSGTGIFYVAGTFLILGAALICLLRKLARRTK